jgi:hypothetical protein
MQRLKNVNWIVQIIRNVVLIHVALYALVISAKDHLFITLSVLNRSVASYKANSPQNTI